MHQFFLTLVALLVSLCHHSSFAHPLTAQATLEEIRPAQALYFPDRHALALSAAVPGYAEAACISCQRMSVSFTAR